MIDIVVDCGVESIVIGMFYCGWLNVLGNVVWKLLWYIFSEFSGGIKLVGEDGSYIGSGDVKYYLGIFYDWFIWSGKNIYLFLVVNFSYLEVVVLVVIGKICVK